MTTNDFKPTKAMRSAKARFWAVVGSNPLKDVASMTTGEMASASKASRLGVWKQNEGFLNWFLNRESTKDLLHAATEEAVLRLWNIVESEPSKEISATAQVNAAKTLLEYAGYAPPKTKVVKYSDEAINQMSEDELKKFVKDGVADLKVVTDD